ncbi:MAG: SLC13 family permease [Anderseniella sp.]|nr:SLC13 family permease [Anderseniella sp.]
MTLDQTVVFCIIVFAMVMFIWNRIRYDVVGLMALLVGVLSGVVPSDHAFAGFGHPAVITVAAVLVISKALQNSGLVDQLVALLAGSRGSPTLQVAAGSTIAAALSTVMNNVGALALMLPVALRNAYEAGRSPSLVLIPLSFASLLGGLVTLIGTPPNIVISGYRESQIGKPFAMFDFAPVGLAVAIAGLVYLITIGWRLLPERILIEDDDTDQFHVERYTLESNVPAASPLVGMRVRELEVMFEREVSVLAIIRKGIRRLAPRAIEKIRADDILILQGDPGLIAPLADDVQLGALGHQVEGDKDLMSEDVEVIEAIVLPNSPIEGKSMRQYRIHDRLGINLLAVARHGRQPTARLKNIRFKTGDVLLFQGETAIMAEALKTLGCLRLADRVISEPVIASNIWMPTGIFAGAIAAAAFGLISVPVAFVGAVLLMVLSNTISLNEVYASIEWPVILLLATLIPVGEALQTTGGTGLIADALLGATVGMPMWTIVAMILVVSMWMSDFVHNTPTAILMAPIAMGIASGLNANPDTFLMAAAVGAASPYLTPIGHQSNTLVMGPGGYRFQDYALVGLPLQVVIALVGVPMILWVWPPV